MLDFDTATLGISQINIDKSQNIKANKKTSNLTETVTHVPYSMKSKKKLLQLTSVTINKRKIFAWILNCIKMKCLQINCVNKNVVIFNCIVKKKQTKKCNTTRHLKFNFKLKKKKPKLFLL